MKVSKRKQRVLAIALTLALLASLTLVGASGLAVVEQELLVNGNFEGGFTFVPGCGSVGTGWGCFNNGGSVKYGFYDDQWAPVVADGAHSQLIELNTIGFGASENDRYAGIYQTVSVVKGATYQFKLRGGMREKDPFPGEDPWRYRVQWGYTTNGSADWTQVGNWVELPWDKIDNRTSPTGLSSFSTSFVAPSDRITLFIRVWKKWANTQKELDVNLDAISLFGSAVKSVVVVPPAGQQPSVVVIPPAGQQPSVVVVPSPTTAPIVVAPQQPAAATCGGTNLVANGDFESGFVNGLAQSWMGFNTGGSAAYGFYDEMWPLVIKDGAHGQLMEINTYGQAASENDRFIGIYQVVSGLTAGATYEFSLSGLMREEAAHPNEDPFRYRVQWGYAAADASPSNTDVTNWTELPWDRIDLRTDPGALQSFSTRFQAPSSQIVLAIRAWKKWPEVGRELDVNLDAIRLVSCGGTPGVVVVPPKTGQQDQCFWYTVQRGDYLSAIAARNGDTVAGLVQRNKLANANLIYAGQKLLVCDP